MFRWLLLIAFCWPSWAFSSVEGLEIKHGELVSHEGHGYSLSEYHSERAPQIALLPGAKLLSCHWLGQKCKAAPWLLKLTGPVPQKPRQAQFVLTYLWQGKKKSFKLDVLSDAFPYMNRVGQSVLTSPLIFSVIRSKDETNKSCKLVVLSPQNELIFYRELPEACTDFRPHKTSDGLFYSYQEVSEGVSNVGLFGTRVVLNEDFSFFKRIEQVYDGHEFILLSKDHWIGMEIELDRLSGGAVYFNKRIRERKNGQVVFDWGVSDYVRQTKSEAVSLAVLAKYRNEVVVDLVHINSIQILNENEWLLGLGYSGVALLNKKERKLSWIFGGFSDQFALPAEQSPIFNHTPIFAPESETLYLFSNRTIGSLIDSAFARVLKYELDVSKRQVKKFHVLRDKKEFAYQMGSLEVHSEVLSIGMGTADRSAYDFVEMKGDVETWSLTLQDPQSSVYRFYRRP